MNRVMKIGIVLGFLLIIGGFVGQYVSVSQVKVMTLEALTAKVETYISTSSNPLKITNTTSDEETTFFELSSVETSEVVMILPVDSYSGEIELGRHGQMRPDNRGNKVENNDEDCPMNSNGI